MNRACPGPHRSARSVVNHFARRGLLACLTLLWPVAGLAQADPNRFQVAAQVTAAGSDQFDETDIGFGGRFSWNPVGAIGFESEINLYPGDFPDERPFSRGRVEGLFGATVGPRVGAARPFGKLRAGFLNVRGGSQPFACILIFPPPLSCELQAGRVLPALDIGGGIELFPTGGTFVRVEIGDRVLRYPGPVLDNQRVARPDAFFSHAVRFAAGAGVSF